MSCKCDQLLITIYFSTMPIICPEGYVSLCGSDPNICQQIANLDVCTFPGQTMPFREVCFNPQTNHIIIVEYQINPKQNSRTLEFCLNGIMNIQATIIGGGAGGGAGNQCFTAGGGSSGVINDVFFTASGRSKLYYTLGGGGFGGTFIFEENNINSKLKRKTNKNLDSNSIITQNDNDNKNLDSNSIITQNKNDNKNRKNFDNNTITKGNNNITSVNGCTTFLQTDQGVQYKALGGVAGSNGVSSNGVGGKFPDTVNGQDGTNISGGEGGKYFFIDLNNSGDGGNGGSFEQSGQNGNPGAIILNIATLNI